MRVPGAFDRGEFLVAEVAQIDPEDFRSDGIGHGTHCYGHVFFSGFAAMIGRPRGSIKRRAPAPAT